MSDSESDSESVSVPLEEMKPGKHYTRKQHECTCGEVLDYDQRREKRKKRMAEPYFDGRCDDSDDDSMLNHSVPLYHQCSARGCAAFAEVSGGGERNDDDYCPYRTGNACNNILCSKHASTHICEGCEDRGYLRCVRAKDGGCNFVSHRSDKKGRLALRRQHGADGEKNTFYSYRCINCMNPKDYDSEGRHNDKKYNSGHIRIPEVRVHLFFSFNFF
jgi:hypothetical protein